MKGNMKKPRWVRTREGRELWAADGSVLAHVCRVSDDPNCGWVSHIAFGDETFVASERSAMRTARAELREIKAALEGI
jgi:hypothetical protein